MIEALSYILINSPHIPAWLQMATTIAGLQAEVIEPNRTVRLRMDGKVQRMLLQATTGKPTLGMGYTVANPDMLEAAVQKVEAAGFAVTRSTPEERALRGVSDMAYFLDPDGYRVELAHGLRDAATLFVPGRPIGGFRTRADNTDLGIGHTALMTGDFAAMKRLYQDVLGFKLSDRASQPFVAEFFHVNPRHHTIGLADTGTGPGVYHFMLEYKDWDDVGRAYDMALEAPESIGVSLGRHLNDHVTSFYLRTPDGWMLELGWAGRLIDPNWQVSELPGMSLWGHDRTWLPDAKREQARQILKKLSAAGLRAPIAPTE